MKKILLFIVVLLAVLAFYYHRTRIAAPPQLNQGVSCDISLWAHVYHGRYPSAEDRLQVINPCLTVTGTIMNASRETDGDWHVRLAPDPEYRSLLNQASLEREGDCKSQRKGRHI